MDEFHLRRDNHFVSLRNYNLLKMMVTFLGGNATMLLRKCMCSSIEEHGCVLRRNVFSYDKCVELSFDMFVILRKSCVVKK
jgi:hypothetical protein